MAGTNLEYGKSKSLLREFVDAIQSEYSDIDEGYVVKYITGKEPFSNKLCRKDSATTPGDRAGDFPNAIGDICLLYNTSGVYQDTYVATTITLTAGAVSAVTWTVLAVSGS